MDIDHPGSHHRERFKKITNKKRETARVLCKIVSSQMDITVFWGLMSL